MDSKNPTQMTYWSIISKYLGKYPYLKAQPSKT